MPPTTTTTIPTTLLRTLTRRPLPPKISSQISSTISRQSPRPFTSSTTSSSSSSSKCTRQNFSKFSFVFKHARASKTGRRFASTAPTEEAATQSWIRRMWDSPIGFKTVHFWAPVMKWCLVIAGISDFARPAEKISLTQNMALTGTGLIWTRWCLIIKPRNVLLAAVNFFLGIVGIVQVIRIVLYNQSQKGEKGAKEQVKEFAGEVKEDVKGVVGK